MPEYGIFSSGLVLALLCAGLLAWWMVRTVSGYELRATGANPDAAAAAGVNTRRVVVWSMAVSGLLAGLAGAVQVCAFEFRFYSGISPGYGFDSLAVALIAMANPIWIVVSSGLFGALAQGAQFAQVQTDMPKEIAAVVQGIVILLAAAVGWRRRRGAE
jgi:simple sugar transport system permease protein